MIYSIIQKSKLANTYRLDAEYYQPEYLELEKKLSTPGTKNLEEISKSIISFGAYSLTSYIEWQESGVPYINVGDVHEGYIDFSSVKHISEKVNEILKKSKVSNGQVLLTMAGTIGNAAVVQNLPQGANANQAIAKITPLDISPYYLVAFLNSKYGLLQTQREIVSSVQANIFLGQIKKFKIPIFNKKITAEIEKEYKGFLNELENSKNLYQLAENLLLEELGLENYEIEDKLSCVVNLSDVKNAHRIDAEYFQLKYEKLIDIVNKKIGVSNLENIFDLRRGVFIDTSFYTEQKTSKPYIRIKELAEKGGINKLEIIYINEKYSDDKNNKLKESDLVVAIIGDTIGKVNKIDKNLSGGYCSNNTARLRVKDNWVNKILPEYSEILFQSIFIQSQIQQKKAQTGQPKINDSEIRSIKIPVLPKAIQQKIADLVRQSHKARSKSKQLLEEAKQKVEDLIEKEKK